jgi:hypothetical protein
MLRSVSRTPGCLPAMAQLLRSSTYVNVLRSPTSINGDDELLDWAI